MGPDFFKQLDEEYEQQEREALNALHASRQKQAEKRKAQEELKNRLQTAHGRFWWRIEKWKEKTGSAKEHHFWWFVHNCIAHPMIGVLPIKRTFDFHDYTSDKINCK